MTLELGVGLSQEDTSSVLASLLLGKYRTLSLVTLMPPGAAIAQPSALPVVLAMIPFLPVYPRLREQNMVFLFLSG